MVKVFGTALGDTQFKQMTAVAAAALLIAVGVTSYAVKERVLISPRYTHLAKHCQQGADEHGRDADGKSGVVKMISQILRTTLHLPPRIQAICWIQFWSWIGRP